ncbi:NAD(P)-dependent oxidoreductase [Vulcanisaeta souniana]|uniref:3-hydroxyisobutyrate dehydrogenase n=1 Tax=Vulcanisaeta souniana JCM 11219 TaxID=1293586 RepID=A0A830EHA2_9CREN|nr:NAD(P)-dependent oxidoreductase [Vulcanisaeta souniana]BDR92641.1 3-hydroxyisobutyrate dehydrogenase [Vulcanisaeta souniana JCM 11219]GGI84693.1 3-hydroxyisobutyrate dehydrogenase [Vulcanisaeta souniana JCM 11219]
MDVTVIGTGRMGGALVRRLVSQGFNVYAWNRTKDRLRGLPAKPIDDVSQARGLTFIFVSDDEALSTVRGVGGELIVLSGTYSINAVTAFNIRFTGMGIGLLAAPVVGGPADIEGGTAIYLVGGPENAYQRAREVFDRLGVVIRLPTVESAMALKLAYNAFLIGSMALLGEYVALGRTFGVNDEALKDLLMKTAFKGVAERYMDRMLKPKSPPSFTLALAAKDMHYAVKSAGDTKTPLVVSSAVKSLYELLAAMGFSNEDYVRAGLLELIGRVKEK